jgi:hypothetical protein
MRTLVVLGLAVICLGFAVPVHAQATGEIYGKVVDASGAVMPGVSVTVSGSGLLQPIVVVTSATGTYRVPQLAVGNYDVRFELTGFKTLLRSALHLELGLNLQVNVTLEVGTLQETVNVTGEQPIVDLRTTGKGGLYTQEQLQSIPTARDQWVIVEQTPGIVMDRQNVGGSQSGQQSTFVSRGAAQSQQKWILDGVDVTDMLGGGASTFYYDFDSLDEMQVTTASSDASMQTSGVGVIAVTKSGTDKFKGSARGYITDETFESDNLTDALRKQGASTGNPIQSVQDYGIEAGGPIKRGRVWFWGSLGNLVTKVGVNNFYKPDPECQAMKADLAKDPLSHSVEEARGCLNTDKTVITNINAKVTVAPFKNNQFTWFNIFSQKVRNSRNASDLMPVETTWRQKPLDGSWGFWGWKSGPSGTWKAADRHVFSDRWMAQIQWAHVNNSYTFAFQDPSQAAVQPSYEISTGLWGRSYYSDVYEMPYNSVDVTTNYFLPGKLGGDHSIKAGYLWRTMAGWYSRHWGGNAVARFSYGQPYSARMYRDSTTYPYNHVQSGYIQDTFTRNRLSVNLGLRWDHQSDEAIATSVPASPFQGQVTMNGTIFTYLPAVSFPGAQDGVAWNNFAPRIALTYDLTGSGKNVVKASFAQYYGQRLTGDLSSTLNTIGAAYVEFPWTDKSKDGFIQSNEIDVSRVITFGGQYNPANPAQTVSPNVVDSNMKNDRSDEILIGFDKEVARDFGVSMSYIWRRYVNSRWKPLIGISSANYSPVTYTPPASQCTVAGARCETVTYYVPNVPLPAPYMYTNQPNYSRSYGGFEATARKRMSHSWMMTASVSYNSTIVNYDGADAYQDPTNIDKYNDAQYAPASSSNSIGNVYLNSKWVARVTGAYQLPWYQIGLAGFYNARQGYPFPQAINIASRPNSAGAIAVLLDPLGDVRLPNFQTVDFRVDKAFTIKRVRGQVTMDIFNLFNSGAILARQPNQNGSTANTVSQILGPRVLRFGLRLMF